LNYEEDSEEKGALKRNSNNQLETIEGKNPFILNHVLVASPLKDYAMGNTITLLGLGKTVYMRSNITSFLFFKELDICVRDIDNLGFELLDENLIEKNKKNVKRYFSEVNLVKQLQRIFES
jgi:hypothetical protein